MAALRRAFPPAEWDVLTTTIDAQIAHDDKQHPARWLTQLSQHYLGEEPIIQSTHKITPAIDKSKTPPHLSRRIKDRSHGPLSTLTCLWCRRTPHANRCDCPASNDTCHGCGKRGHWKEVCRATSAHAVSEAVSCPGADLQEDYLVTHEVYQVQ